MSSSSNDKHAAPLSKEASLDRDWIVSELVKGVQAERTLASEVKARAGSPPDSTLGVVYHEMAAADERHAAIIEIIATRYGHTPSRSSGSGLGQVWTRLKDSVGAIGSSALDQLAWDLTAKAQSVHWYAAWVRALTAIGDSASASELSAVLTEEETHRDALQQGLNRLTEQLALGGGDRTR